VAFTQVFERAFFAFWLSMVKAEICAKVNQAVVKRSNSLFLQQ